MPLAKPKCRIVTVANQKGGVGKTTTVMNLGSALAREGRKVLLIDSDAQANLTSYLGVSPARALTDVLIPVQPEFFSLEGIVKIQESIEEIRGRWNPGLRIGGILVTQANFRRKLTAEVIQTLKGEFPDWVLETVIHENASISESTGHARSVLHYAPGSTGAEDYLALGREFISREGSRR